MKQISISVLILCTCFVSAAWGQQNGWREFHRPDMVRMNPYETVLNVNNVGGLSLKWNFATGNEVYSSPALANGVVYIGSWDGNVYALNAETGRQTVELRHRQPCKFLAHRDERHGLRRLGRRQSVRLRSAIKVVAEV
jgi:PQQ-like domain